MKIHTKPVPHPIITFESQQQSLDFCKQQLLPPVIKYNNSDYKLLAVNPDFSTGKLYYVKLDDGKQLIEIEHFELLQKSNTGEIGTYYNLIRLDDKEAREAAIKHGVPFQIYVDRMDEANKFKKYADKRSFDPSKNSILRLVRAREDGILIYGLTENANDTMTLYTNVKTLKEQIKKDKIIDFAELTN